MAKDVKKIESEKASVVLVNKIERSLKTDFCSTKDFQLLEKYATNNVK